MMIVSINPHDGAELARFALHTAHDIDERLSAAARAQSRWRQVHVQDRVALLRAFARILRAGKSRFAELITREMGKPIVESEAEIENALLRAIITPSTRRGSWLMSQLPQTRTLWTDDLDRARKLARSIDAGAVSINGMAASDARLPFGGIKKSGYGREPGVYGIKEFTNIKSVWIGPAQA